MEGSSFWCPRTFVQTGKLFSHNSSCCLMGCVKLGDNWHQNHTCAEKPLAKWMETCSPNVKKIIKDIKDVICLCIQSAVPEDPSHLIATQDCSARESKGMQFPLEEQVCAPVTEGKGNFQDKLQSLLCAFSKFKANWFCARHSILPWLEVNQVKMWWCWLPTAIAQVLNINLCSCPTLNPALLTLKQAHLCLHMLQLHLAITCRHSSKCTLVAPLVQTALPCCIAPIPLCPEQLCLGVTGPGIQAVLCFLSHNSPAWPAGSGPSGFAVCWHPESE